MSTKVKLSRSGSGTWKVKIGHTNLAFSNNVAECVLADGEYTLEWWITAGIPNGSFKLGIDSPDTIKWSTGPDACLDNHGKTDGMKAFRLGRRKSENGA